MVRSETMVAVQGSRFETLGDLVWYTVSQMLVDREELERAFQAGGLDPGYLPGPITAHDAFRRATSERDAVAFDLGNGRRENLLIREVASDRERVVRQVVREVVDAQNVRLEYTPIASLVLDKASGEVRIEWLFEKVRHEEGTHVAEVVRHYQICREHYNDIHVRDMLRRILASCQPTPLRRSGGVYFVPRGYRDKVAGLKAFLEVLSAGRDGGSALWAVPVIDTQEQRDMVKAHLAEHVALELERLKSEMADMLRSGKEITQTQAQRYAEAVRSLQAQVSAYQELLREALDQTQSNVEIVLQQTVSLLQRTAT